MPIIQSAKKRIRVSSRQHVANLRTKRAMKDAIKQYNTAVATKKVTTEMLRSAQSEIDTAVKKGVLSKNKASRMKRKLHAEAKAAGTSTKSTTQAPKNTTKTRKKPAAKKAPGKKSPVKKSVTKKSTTKK